MSRFSYLLLSAVLCLTCLTGCGSDTSADEDLQTQEFKYTTECLTELCICHSINADGSIMLWGDREEGKKFTAYAVANTLDLAQNDEVAIMYNENERQHAPHTETATYIMYILPAHSYELSKITPAIAQTAVEGSRQKKYIAKFETEAEEIAATQKAATALTSTITSVQEQPVEVETESDLPEPMPDEPIDLSDELAEIEPTITSKSSFVMDASMISEGGTLKITVSKGKHYITEFGGKTMILNGEESYCFATKIYEVSEDSFLGTVLSSPNKNSILIFVNSDMQLQAGRINNASPAPDGTYLINFKMIPFNSITVH